MRLLRLLRLFAPIALISLLAACGQKGPLYLPQTKPVPAAHPAAPAPATVTLPQPTTLPPQ
ncbi:MAG TPA: lipoprotein [Gammaproteobacteria bacterium]|nr:lipoprotein [Gammaproteobacteria bacterium]